MDKEVQRGLVTRMLSEIERIKGEPDSQEPSVKLDTSRLGALLKQYLAPEGRFLHGREADKFGMGAGELRQLIGGGSYYYSLIRVEALLRNRLGAIDMEFQADAFAGCPWRLASSVETQEIISRLSLSLGHLIKTLRSSNEIGSEKSTISALQKAQLVALLESTLAMLSAPAIKADETSGTLAWMRRLFIRGAEKGFEKGVSDALSSAISDGADLLQNLSLQRGAADLDKLV